MSLLCLHHVLTAGVHSCSRPGDLPRHTTCQEGSYTTTDYATYTVKHHACYAHNRTIWTPSLRVSIAFRERTRHSECTLMMRAKRWVIIYNVRAYNVQYGLYSYSVWCSHRSMYSYPSWLSLTCSFELHVLVLLFVTLEYLGFG